MITKLVTIGSEQDLQKLEEAAKIMKDGGLVAFPTETVYGLGGDALQSDAAQKIYAAKGRPSDNPLIVHISRIEDLSKIAKNIPNEAYSLAEHFWPGPLTMIFDKRSCVPDSTTGGMDTVAVRMPSHPVALELIRRSGGFIAAPSANTSGRPSPTKASHVEEDLNGKIPMIVDGGSVGIGLESTIIDFTAPIPTILRPGFLTVEDFEPIIGEVRIDPGIIASDSKVKPKAPGMKYRHYAPGGALTIVRGNRKRVAEYIKTKAFEHGDSKKVCVLCLKCNENYYAHMEHLVLGNDMQEIAANLFSVLRICDDKKADIIYSEAIEETGLGRAIMNRLKKAAGGQIVDV
ncbi:L-threonylcarbamoyladenylate synthase [Eubacterium oxidoreducens]|uniref:Threonylcarbamoyl-AMP synthase n=1 Tax=Eubacterium oxidoreducens TaxID=1732 RepID=A0A1G6C889_EUBOX|nr:L-threonylcarbamoyladenylate synthase [Eubacterium oxidoreducens]SDB29086.1 L-threonylcarbamoyladenylate synthase [Eubacterium oxidoreducens]